MQPNEEAALYDCSDGGFGTIPVVHLKGQAGSGGRVGGEDRGKVCRHRERSQDGPANAAFGERHSSECIGALHDLPLVHKRMT